MSTATAVQTQLDLQHHCTKEMKTIKKLENKEKSGGIQNGNKPVLKGPILKGPVLKGPILKGPILKGPGQKGPILKGPILKGPATFKGPILKGPIVKSWCDEMAENKVPLTSEEQRRRLKRKARFSGADVTEATSSDHEDNTEPDGLSLALSAARPGEEQSSSKRARNKIKQEGRFVGTKKELEKPYLRLTTFPKAEQIRPQEVLVKSLALIKSRYFQNEDFEWANEQLKSVRQDITVQRLRNRFVLEVYETHARILLEHGDLNEFNQCQTVIRYLTTTGLDLGDITMDTIAENELNSSNNDEESATLAQCDEAADEFRAYWILYSLIQNSKYDLTKAIAHERESKSSSYEKNSSSRHALQVMKAVIHNDYRAFFRLYESAPHMSAYLMDFLVKRMREGAYERIIAAYRPTISVEHFREALYFQDLEETRCFLKKSGAIFVNEKGEPPFWVDCKASK